MALYTTKNPPQIGTFIRYIERGLPKDRRNCVGIVTSLGDSRCTIMPFDTFTGGGVDLICNIGVELRPCTAEEASDYLKKQIEHWKDSIETAQEQMNLCEEQLGKLSGDPAEQLGSGEFSEEQHDA